MTENTAEIILKTSVDLEIENAHFIKDDCIEIILPNGEVSLLIVQPLLNRIYCKNQTIMDDNAYVSNHDCGNIGENNAKKLLLRNLKDVKDYALDAVKNNIIGVEICNNTVFVPNETTVQIIVQYKPCI